MVGSLRRYALSPELWVTDDPLAGSSVVPDGGLVAQLRVTSMLLGADGGTEVLSSGTGRVWLPARSASDIVQPGSDRTNISESISTANSFAPITFNNSYIVRLGKLPAFTSIVLAVDPIAEMQLLGEENAAFLDRLIRVPFERETEGGEVELGWKPVPKEREATEEWADLVDRELSPVAWGHIVSDVHRAGVAAPIVPLIINGEPMRQLELRLDISLAERAVSDAPMDLETLRALPDESFVPWATLEAGISNSLIPLSSSILTLVFPGDTLPDGENGGVSWSDAASLEPMLIGRPSYVGVDAPGNNPAFEVVPGDVVGSDGLPVGSTYADWSGMDSAVGLVRSFRSMTGVGGDSGVLVAPLDTFTLANIIDPAAADASYVPLGFSATTNTWRDLSGGERENVLANLSGVDFITAAPGAFTDLEGGRTLRGGVPIDAIRVRVAGITSYTPEAQNKIVQVAGQIELLGLNATIVAGSSPQEVSLYVPDYFVDAIGNSADLGWVSQEWSTLGAAITVEAALSGTTLALAVVALVSGTVGLGVTTLANARRLRPIVAGLAQIGWRRSHIRKRLVLELAPPYLLVGAVGMGCSWLGPSRLGLLFATATSIAVGLWGVELFSGMRREVSRFPDRRSDTRPVASVDALAWRLLMSRASSVAVTLLSSASVAGLAALTVAAVRDGRERSGATRLSVLALSTTDALTVTLGVLGIGFAILLLVLAHQSERQQLAADSSVLTGIGFTRALQAAIVRKQELIIAAGAILISILAIGAVVIVTDGGFSEQLAGTATLLSVIVTRLAVSASNNRKL
jgi:hypothetical protein